MDKNFLLIAVVVLCLALASRKLLMCQRLRKIVSSLSITFSNLVSTIVALSVIYLLTVAVKRGVKTAAEFSKRYGHMKQMVNLKMFLEFAVLLLCNFH